MGLLKSGNRAAQGSESLAGGSGLGGKNRREVEKEISAIQRQRRSAVKRRGKNEKGAPVNDGQAAQGNGENTDEDDAEGSGPAPAEQDENGPADEGAKGSSHKKNSDMIEEIDEKADPHTDENRKYQSQNRAEAGNGSQKQKGRQESKKEAVGHNQLSDIAVAEETENER